MSDITVGVITPSNADAPSSAVSWPAVLAGILAAFGFTLILLALGAAFGLGAASPWTAVRDAGAIGAGAAAWLVVVQWLSSALGGYIAGRLRTRWPGVHAHEVFFRDTAHGLLAWAGATVLIALLGAAAAASGGGAAADMAAKAAGPAYAYDADLLFRAPGTDPAATVAARGEAQRLLAVGSGAEGLSAADRGYLAASVATATRLSPADAGARVDEVVAREARFKADAVQAADKARKAAAGLALLTALSLLAGAFVGCVGAAIGGLERDRHA